MIPRDNGRTHREDPGPFVRTRANSELEPLKGLESGR